MKNRFIFLISILAIVSMLIAACAQATPAPQTTEKPAPATEKPAPATEKPAVATQAPAATEPVKLSLYSVAWMSTDQAKMSELVKKFNEEHKGKIEVEYLQGDWGEEGSYITAGAAGGGGIADIIETDTGTALSWYNQGFLADLRPYITDEVRASMPTDLWASRTAADGAVFISGTVTGSEILVFYNPAALEKAGITPASPDHLWTWDDLVANAKILTVDANGKHLGEAGFDAKNVKQWGFVPRIDNEKVWEEASIFVMQATGQPMVRKGSDGKWDIFFDDAGIPVLKAYTNLVNEGVTPPEAVGLGGDTQNELFYQGQAAMILRGYFNVAVIEGQYPDFKFAVMPIPMSADNKVYYADNSGQGYTVPITSKHPSEAAEFLFWMQQPEQQAIHSSGLAMAPTNPAALQDPLLMNDPTWDTMRFYRSIEKLVNVEVDTNTPEFVTTLYAPSLMAVVSGDKTFEDAINEIKSSSKAILNQ